MTLMALCLTVIVFPLTNPYPNLEKLAKAEGNFRVSDPAGHPRDHGDRGAGAARSFRYSRWIAGGFRLGRLRQVTHRVPHHARADDGHQMRDYGAAAQPSGAG
ncbi:MAG: hypothetical protein AB7E21_18335, partial [Pseudodonghicola sp.]